MDTEVVHYWRHERCGNKIQFVGGGAWCPLCRCGVTEGGTLVEFENPVGRVQPMREGSDLPLQMPTATRSHSAARGFFRRDWKGF